MPATFLLSLGDFAGLAEAAEVPATFSEVPATFRWCWPREPPVLCATHPRGMPPSGCAARYTELALGGGVGGDLGGAVAVTGAGEAGALHGSVPGGEVLGRGPRG